MSGLENPHDEVVLLQCNLDDMTGEALGFVLERVLAEGALDAWFVPIQMKKSRPGTTLSVLCRRKDAAALRKLLLRETTTLGVRWQVMQREIVQRQTVDPRLVFQSQFVLQPACRIVIAQAEDAIDFRQAAAKLSHNRRDVLAIGERQFDCNRIAAIPRS